MTFLLALSSVLTLVWAAFRTLVMLTGGRILAFMKWATASKFGPACVGLIMLGTMLALQVLAWRWAKAELDHLRSFDFGGATSHIQTAQYQVVTAISGAYGALNQVLPLSELMVMVGTSLSVEAALFSAVLVRAYGQTLFGLIPGGRGGRSALEWIRWYFGLEQAQQDVWFGF